MSVAAKGLISAQYAPNAIGTIYTSPNNVYTIIDKFTLTNVTAGALTITIYIVPSNQTAANSNLIVYQFSLAAHATYDMTIMQNQVLNPSDFIQVVASAANSVVVRGSGRQVT